MTTPLEGESIRHLVVGESSETIAIRCLIARIAPAPLPVWIEGETGVGKEQIAQALHAASGRRGPFVAVNVCAIAESMFEDAFFGHVRGAFTDARDDTIGHFGEATDGTLFLDEISGLPVAAQVKLLRAVETNRYRQVGGRADRPSRVRIVAASNEPAEHLVGTGRLRADLAYRLRGGVLRVPPLRARRADIPSLVEHFLAADAHSGPTDLSEQAKQWLVCAEWRGNVREMRQVLACARTLAIGESIELADLRAAFGMLALRSGEPKTAPPVVETTPERLALLSLLDRHEWDTARVAAALEVDRTTVYRRMRRLAIQARQVGEKRAPQVGLHSPGGRLDGTSWAPIGRPSRA